MPLIEYQSLTKNGNKIQAIISADSLDEAKSMLQMKSIIIVKISIIKAILKPLSKKELIIGSAIINIAIEAGIANNKQNSIARFCVFKALLFSFLIICIDNVGKRAVPS